MENLKLTRIDFRLIHGQVMTRWVAKYEIESIVVIDDRSAKSPILKKILLGAAPAGVKVLVWNVAEAAEMCIRDRPYAMANASVSKSVMRMRLPIIVI